MTADRLRVWAGFLTVCVVWGSTWLAIKMGLSSVPPFLAAGLRFVVATLILWIVVRLRGTRVPFDRDARKLYGTLAVLSYTLPFGLTYWGQQYIPSGLSSILFAMYPFWVALFSQLILASERLNLFKVAGIILGFVGLLIIFGGDVHWTDRSGFFGMTAVLVSTMVQGLALVLIKKYGQPVSPFAMNLIGMLGGAISLLALSAITESWRSAVWDAAAFGSILYLAVFGSVVAFVTYHWMLKRIEAVYLSLVSFINPILAVVLGAIVLGETLARSVFLGATFVLCGILVANGNYFYEKISAALRA